MLCLALCEEETHDLLEYWRKSSYNYKHRTEASQLSKSSYGKITFEVCCIPFGNIPMKFGTFFTYALGSTNNEFLLFCTGNPL